MKKFATPLNLKNIFVFAFTWFYFTSVNAGLLSNAICRTYTKYVDRDFFGWVAVVALIMCLVGAKLAAEKGVVGKGVAILALLAAALAAVEIISNITGTSLMC